MVAFKKLILLRVAFNGLRFDLCLWLNYKNFMVYAQICYIGTSDKWLNLYSVLCNWYKLQSPWSFGLGLLFSVFKFFLFNVISLFLAALKRFPKRSSIPEEGPSAMLLHGSSWSVLGSCSTGSILSLFPEIVGRVFSIRFLGDVCRAMLTKHNVIWLDIWHFNLRFWN